MRGLPDGGFPSAFICEREPQNVELPDDHVLVFEHTLSRSRLFIFPSCFHTRNFIQHETGLNQEAKTSFLGGIKRIIVLSKHRVVWKQPMGLNRQLWSGCKRAFIWTFPGGPSQSALSTRTGTVVLTVFQIT